LIKYFHSDFDGVNPSVGKPPLVNRKNYIDIDNSDPIYLIITLF